MNQAIFDAFYNETPKLLQRYEKLRVNIKVNVTYYDILFIYIVMHLSWLLL